LSPDYQIVFDDSVGEDFRENSLTKLAGVGPGVEALMNAAIILVPLMDGLGVVKHFDH